MWDKTVSKGTDCKTDEQAILAALASLFIICNTLSTVPSFYHISSGAKALSCKFFMQSLLSELYSILDSESIFIFHVCFPSIYHPTLNLNSGFSIIAFPLGPQINKPRKI